MRPASDPFGDGWNWVQFFGAGLLFGACAYVGLASSGITREVHLGATGAVALAAGLLAGRFGDRAWQWIRDVLFWW